MSRLPRPLDFPEDRSQAPPISLHRESYPPVPKPIEHKENRELLFVYLGLGAVIVAVTVFITLSVYTITRLATRTTEVAEHNTQNARNIATISKQLKQQASALQRDEATNNQILQALHDTYLHDQGRINDIEEGTNSLQKTIGRLAANESRLAAKLDSLAAVVSHTIAGSVPPLQSTILRMQPPAPQPSATSPTASVETVPSKHQHIYLDNVPPPPGTVVLNENGQATWVIQKDGKDQKVRPIEQTTMGVLVHNFIDGRDYLISQTEGIVKWLGEAY
jgi:hypothetical protein